MTARQSQLLAFIKAYIAGHGHSPSYDEMAAHMGVKSRSVIHGWVKALIDDGKITMQPHRARSIDIARVGACPHCGGQILLDGGAHGEAAAQA